ncbi:DUF6473 family protein [Tabrizicola sp.]|uniref:DUF6473 family protein n=1 Tax=Tabrizicola sp. TaxID=2005166 RepID=UPI00286C038F|nr:DUF6473 family protein [Tabrizicola sp.]
MSYGFAGAGAPDYFPCRYGMSRSVFRGPRRDLSGAYLAMIGGSQTFGKYVTAPFPTLVEEAMGVPVANLGGLNAGPEFYLADPETLAIARGARLAVVQITGAEALSNRYYTVHSRRNDRFLGATPALRALYPEVEFTDIHFTRHLLLVLQAAGVDRFAKVVAALKSTWIDRMRTLLSHLPRQRILLWMADDPVPDNATQLDPGTPFAGPGPLLVDGAMVAALLPEVSTFLQVVPSAAARAEGVRRMQFPESAQHSAHCLPGATAHREAAEALIPAILRVV